ncbi:ArsR/SmtB family transcription factor [Salsipaludibacter albus]|uniref:ArsR/SmtB family transcription factor n=1 Tax=Salsipaludibacter albus TaxID=2849650 RepID=UPI001EE4ABA2|nr:metalloregulator ArsR/SmtB family transcription factor [Salsipaludibacter albus]MBY5163250.1 metalloregulator ArsR/SmtB family transcription factor [Salsipaludibacter albus]
MPATPCCPPLAGGVLSTDDAERLAAVLKSLADPVRLRLLSLVATAAAGEVCACDLPQAVDRSQSTVSHHLSQLVDAGLLHREQRGKWAWFRVDDAAMADVASALRLPGTRSTI